MSRNRRLLVAALTIIALFSAIVLAAGLSALQVGEQRAPQLLRRETVPTTPGASGDVSTVVAHTETLTERSVLPMILIALALAIVIIFMLVTAEGRKMLVYTLLVLLLLLFVVLLRERSAGPSRAASTPEQASEETPASSSPSFTFDPPPWLILGASLGLALLLVGGIGLAGLRLSRRERSRLSASTLPELAEEARQALADIRSGLNLRDTIIRCYRDMGETLQSHRGLRRGLAMTPEEFARGLAPTNLPQEEIWRITQLFERVRYGQHVPQPEEEAEAIASLTAIVQACEVSS